MKQPVSKAAMKKAGGKADAPKASTSSSPGSLAKPDRRWEVEDAMRTIMRADELKSDTKLMADVKKHAAAQAAKMATICKK